MLGRTEPFGRPHQSRGARRRQATAELRRPSRSTASELRAGSPCSSSRRFAGAAAPVQRRDPRPVLAVHRDYIYRRGSVAGRPAGARRNSAYEIGRQPTRGANVVPSDRRRREAGGRAVDAAQARNGALSWTWRFPGAEPVTSPRRPPNRHPKARETRGPPWRKHIAAKVGAPQAAGRREQRDSPRSGWSCRAVNRRNERDAGVARRQVERR